MDKNTSIGLFLIALVLGAYFYFEQQKKPSFEAQKKYQDSVAAIKKSADLSMQQQNKTFDSLKQQQLNVIAVESLGSSMAAQLNAEEKLISVENDHFILEFTNKGAQLNGVQLKNYKSYNDFIGNKEANLNFFNGKANNFALTFFAKSQDINTSKFYFEPQTDIKSIQLTTQDSLVLPFRLVVDSASYLSYDYTIYKNSFKVKLDVRFVGMEKQIDPKSTVLDANWKLDLLSQEKSYKNENTHTTIFYKEQFGDVDDLSISTDPTSEKVATKLEWINFKQHFFSAILVVPGANNAVLSYVPHKQEANDGILKSFDAKMDIEFTNTTQHIPFEFYFIPNHYKTLAEYDRSFEKIITLGGSIIGVVNLWLVIPVFDFLRNYIESFGLIILILTILIKLLITPLTWKSYISSAKMKVLKPEVDKIGEKYPDQKDAMKKQQEVMALYSKTGVNMFGGCLPMLLQMPILYALFRFFPSSIELRQENFLWADDLSAYDSILNLPFAIPFYGSHVSLFTILMAVSMYFSTKISMAQQGNSNPQMKQMNMMMLYVMPVFMLAFFNDFSSGLTYYYFLSNIITIGQTYVIRTYFVDEAEILRKMNEKAKNHKPKSKKGGFANRLQNWAEKQQKAQQQQQKSRKK